MLPPVPAPAPAPDDDDEVFVLVTAADADDDDAGGSKNVERFKAAQTRGSTARSTALSVGCVLKMPLHAKMSSALLGSVVDRGAGSGREAPAHVSKPVGFLLLAFAVLLRCRAVCCRSFWWWKKRALTRESKGERRCVKGRR